MLRYERKPFVLSPNLQALASNEFMALKRTGTLRPTDDDISSSTGTGRWLQTVGVILMIERPIFQSINQSIFFYCHCQKKPDLAIVRQYNSKRNISNKRDNKRDEMTKQRNCTANHKIQQRGEKINIFQRRLYSRHNNRAPSKHSKFDIKIVWHLVQFGVIWPTRRRYTQSVPLVRSWSNWYGTSSGPMLTILPKIQQHSFTIGGNIAVTRKCRQTDRQTARRANRHETKFIQ